MRVRKWALTLLGLTLGLFFMVGSAGQNALRPLELDAGSAPFPGNGQGFVESVAAAQQADEDDQEDEDGNDEDEEDEDELEYRGVIISLSDNQLVLEDGTTFVINSETEFETGIAVGSEVEVEANLMALEIEPAEDEEGELEFEGVVASLSATELVLEDGMAFVINDATEFEGDVQVGSEVDVDAIESNGSLTALEIEVKTEEDAEDDENELEFEGVVGSIIVVLEDGTAFMVNEDTEFESEVGIGAGVDVDAFLLAVEVEVADEPDDEEDEEGQEDEGQPDQGQHSAVSQKGPTFGGMITSLSDTRLGLNNRLTFVIDGKTEFKGEAAVGAEADVQFEVARGLLMARTVAVKTGAQQGGEGDSGEIDLEDLQPQVDNPLFPLPPLVLLVYEGQEESDGEVIETRVEIRVLPDTEEVAGVEVTAALVEEYEDGDLIERTLDFYAQDSNGTVIYMGEYVDEIENGQVVGHPGQWLAGEGDNLPGVFMPADPKVGDVFEQERAPGLAEDRSEVVETGVNVNVPAGAYTGCIKTEDFDPIGGEVEFKFYCPGVGLMREESEEGHLDLISVGAFDPSELDEEVIDDIGGGDAEDSEDENDEADESDDEGELEIAGVVKSLSDTELVLEDGTIPVTV